MSQRAASIRVVAHWLARGGLFALWALVGWGTLLVLVTLANVASQGPRTALSHLVPGPGASIWSLVSFVSVGLALVAWMAIAGLVVATRLGDRPDEPEPAGPDDAAPASAPGSDPPGPAPDDEHPT